MQNLNSTHPTTKPVKTLEYINSANLNLDLNISDTLNDTLNLNKTLQTKYPHLEISILPLSIAQDDNEKSRIDAEFFSKKFINAYEKIKKISFSYLGECLQTLTDYHSNGSYEILNDNVKIKDEKDYAYMIRSTDFEKMDFENEVKYVSNHAYNFLSKTKIFGGEVLINKIGSPGSTYFVPYLNKPTTLGMNLFLLKTNEKLNNAFLYIFLNTKIGKTIIERKISGAVPPTIDKEAIKTLPIPIFPQNFQLEIENLVKNSHKALENSKNLYKEAERLLYEALGLDFINPLQSLYATNPALKSVNFTIRSLKESYLTTGRIDSEYYQEKYDLIEGKIKEFPYKKLGDLVSIKKSIEPGSEAYQSEGIEFVRVANLSKFGISKSEICLNRQEFANELAELAPKKETILLSKDGSVGTSYCLDEDLECITSGAILHLQVKDKNEILSQVLSLILNSIVGQLQAERDAGGSIIAHWKISEIENIIIPKIDEKTQELIARKIQNSFALRKEAKNLLAQAVSKIETTIAQATK